MKKYVSKNADERLLSYLRSCGYETEAVFRPGLVAPGISDHPDCFMVRFGIDDEDNIAMADDSDITNECAFNAVCTGKYFIHNFSMTSPGLLKAAEMMEMKMIDVRQGYSKCSTVIVNEESIITYDKSIALPAEKAGMNVLTVSPGHVNLPGYDEGFIGGTSGLIDSHASVRPPEGAVITLGSGNTLPVPYSPGLELVFNGDLEKHPDFMRIRDFAEELGVSIKYFCEWPLTDIGSII